MGFVPGRRGVRGEPALYAGLRAATVVQVLRDFDEPPSIAPRPPTTVANPHIDLSLGSKETHIQSHNRACGVPAAMHVV